MNLNATQMVLVLGPTRYRGTIRFYVRFLEFFHRQMFVCYMHLFVRVPSVYRRLVYSLSINLRTISHRYTYVEILESRPTLNDDCQVPS